MRKSRSQQMVRYRMASRRPGQMLGRGKRRMRGRGWWDSIKKFAVKANKFLKKSKLISTGLAAIDNPYAQAGSLAAGAIGYGKRRKRVVRRRRKGRGISLAGSGRCGGALRLAGAGKKKRMGIMY